MKYLKYIFLSALFLSIGCETTPEVYVVKQWEGHFYNTNDFQKATQNIDLQKKESIWVLSNKTLLKTLENAKK